MVCSVGDVIRLPNFKFAQSNDGSPRYAIVVEDLGDSYYMIGLTTRLYQTVRYPNAIEVLLNSAEGKQMGIVEDSLIACGSTVGERLEFTMPKKFFRCPPMLRKGVCSEELINRIIEMTCK